MASRFVAWFGGFGFFRGGLVGTRKWHSHRLFPLAIGELKVFVLGIDVAHSCDGADACSANLRLDRKGNTHA